MVPQGIIPAALNIYLCVSPVSDGQNDHGQLHERVPRVPTGVHDGLIILVDFVAESQEPGVHVAEVAVRHDIAASLLHGWRHQARHGRLSAEGTAGFVPVRMLESQRAACSHSATAAPIEVALPDGSRLNRPVAKVGLSGNRSS